ncbi:MAG: HAMP domain-containing histidine kinase [Agathobacter sp.]|nr:HAMP domain-containing histidine kinase [Agathobacter sp.]
MKRTLFLKLLGSYLFFALLALVLLGTFTQTIAENYLKKSQAEKLYRESTVMASELRKDFSNPDNFPDMQDELEIIAGYMGAEIWLIDSQKQLLLDSSDPIVHRLAISRNPKTLESFNVGDFGNVYYQVGTFYDCFKEPTLTVYSPITVDYKVRAYVLIHKSLTSVVADADSIVNIVFTSSILILACTFIILLATMFFIYRPVRIMNKAADSYAKGDFKERINIRSNDEIGYIAKTMNYMATELDTLEDEQKKFISNVSHDFRSPLTSIKGYIEAMLDGTIPVEMQEKYLNIILFETERLNKLTQSILDLNRFRGQGMLLDITEFDINSMIRTTIQTFEGTCGKKGLSFDLVLTEEQLFVQGDSGKIQQVLYNLIDNATKFSHNNSAITIETTIKNGKVFISIKDTGIGIPKDSIKKIWERFYKTDQSRGKDKKGTGLGLAIVKEIVQAHKQNINVISTEGVGTEFIFTLKLAEKEL